MNKKLAFLLFAVGGTALGYFLGQGGTDSAPQPAEVPETVQQLKDQLEKKNYE